MSGFAGFVQLGAGSVPPGTEERLIHGISGAGLAKPKVHRIQNAVFVFRQRVVYPEDRWERQPSVGPGVVSMFDGRLDNRAELLDALGLRSRVDDPIPDGRLARIAYERWEEAAVPRLLGDFAWAVWNSRARRLMLARNHDWHRALFFSRGAGFIAFATGYRPLLALPEVPRDVDEVAAFDLLLTCPDESERSFYKSISWVIPAGRVVADADGVRQDRVWEPVRQPTLRLRRDEDYVEAARAVFEDAVACRLRSSGPVVCSMSGGLDSSAIAATAARRLPEAAVHGLTVVPTPGETLHNPLSQYGDERPYVQALGRRYPNLLVECLESRAAAEFELDPTAMFLHGQVPVRSPSNAGWFQVIHRRASELGATTLIVGSLGNLTFSATGMNRLSLLRRDGAWGAFAWEMAALRWTHPHKWAGLMRYHALALLPDALSSGLRRWWRRWRGRVPPWWQNSLVNPDVIRDPLLEERFKINASPMQDVNQPGGRIAAMRYHILRSRMQVEGYAVLRSHSGLTWSDPFADRRVIDFCLSLPEDQFLRSGRTRALARRAFADRLPPEILHNPLRGAQSSDWHRRILPHRDRLAAELERVQTSALAARLLDLPRMKRMLDSWPSDPRQFIGEAAHHRLLVARALHLGQYLRWIEGGNL
ncbi:asparagine synthase-related protein [Azospirillum sp.]|uniref:asparagine synthase-related protein n=1 Tax=Azospirillum sp. TaxID=34012 RepID=UPI003D7579CB